VQTSLFFYYCVVSCWGFWWQWQESLCVMTDKRDVTREMWCGKGLYTEFMGSYLCGETLALSAKNPPTYICVENDECTARF
jgi:hypothetical protein